MGIDVGEKRIGVAITDKLNRIAYPLTVIEKNDKTKEKLLDIIKEHNIEKIVVGIPYNLKGEAGYQTKIVNDFIEENLKDLKLIIIPVDERFTSKISENILAKKVLTKNRPFKKSLRSDKSGNIDKLSASIILGDYLKREEIRVEQKLKYRKIKN